MRWCLYHVAWLALSPVSFRGFSLTSRRDESSRIRRRYKTTFREEEHLKKRSSMFSEEDYDEDESYESKWRRRRIQSLKMSPELSPSELEDLFEADYLERKLYVREPNRAFGAVFKLEGAVAEVDVVPTFTAAWALVAEEFGYEAPEEEAVAYVVQHSLRDEVAVDRVFRWTQDWGVARDMSRRYIELVSEKFEELDIEPRHGMDAWLDSLDREGVPCAVVSKLPRNMLDNCLERLGFDHYFEQRIVAAEDERDRPEQAFLHAAIVLERQPSRCFVFTDAVSELIGAHEAEMRAVGFIGKHPAYELQIADLVVDDLSDLRLPSIRKLFSDVDFEPDLLPEADLELTKRTLTKTYEDDYDDDYYDYE